MYSFNEFCKWDMDRAHLRVEILQAYKWVKSVALLSNKKLIRVMIPQLMLLMPVEITCQILQSFVVNSIFLYLSRN
jgi:hypothetical protein